MRQRGVGLETAKRTSLAHRALPLLAAASLAGLVTILSTAALHAQEARGGPSDRVSDWSGTAGLGVFTVPKYLGSDERRIVALPLVSVEYKKRFFLGGGAAGAIGGLGAYLVRTPNWSWTASVGGGDRRPESRGPALAGMGDHGFGVSASTGVGYRAGIFHTSFDATRGLNSGRGWTGGFHAGVGSRPSHGWFASLNTGVTLADAKQMQYDFGIDDAQAARRRLLIAAGDPHLRPGDAGPFSPGAGLQSIDVRGNVGYILSPHWTLLGSLSAARLEGDAARSPLVRQRNQYAGGGGLSRRW
jgi:outer membrane protein